MADPPLIVARSSLQSASDPSFNQYYSVFLIVLGIEKYFDGMRYLHVSPHKIQDMDAIPWCTQTCDITWYGILYHHRSRYVMRYHTGSPQDTRQKRLLRKWITLLRPTLCFEALSLLFSCVVFCLFSFVVLLLPIRRTHHRTDRTTSKHQPYPPTTRPATSVHYCFCFVSLFSFFPCLFFLLVIYFEVNRMVSVSRYPKIVHDIDVDKYRKYQNIAWYTEKSRYDTE